MPVTDADGWLWEDTEEDLYIVKDFPFQPAERFSFSLEQFSRQILALAKQGQYTKLKSEFDEKCKQELMQLNLFHYSSDDSFAFKPLWDESQGCYKRASYPCEKGK